MKILYIDDIPTPYRIGIHRQLSISEDTYRVLFCAPDEPGRSWNLNFSGLNYEILNGWQIRPPRQENPFSFKYNPGVSKAMHQFQPDVVILSGYVHPTMWRAASWCRHNRVPYGIASESSQITASKSSFKTWLKNTLMGPVIRGATFGLPVSRAAGEHLKNLANNKKLATFQFPNTPDISAIQAVVDTSAKAILNRTDLQKFGIPSEGKIILFVGRLIDAKRPLDLMKAYRQLPENLREQAHLVFVGDGPLRNKLSATKGELGSIFDIGWISDSEQLTRIMASSDLFVLPSSHEPWGAVINEAMACGLPVIASDQVGAAQDMIINNKNGSVFSCGDTNRLTDLIAYHLESVEVEDYRRAAKKTAKEFGESFAVKNMKDAIQYAVSTISHSQASTIG